MENVRSQKFDFPSLQNSSPGQFLVSSNSRRYHSVLNFFGCNLKIRVLGAKSICGFFIILNLKRIMEVLK